MKLTIELTREQAKAVQDACEQYIRQRIGQFDAIAEDLAFRAHREAKDKKLSDSDFAQCLIRRDFVNDGMERLYLTATKGEWLHQVDMEEAYTAEIVWLAIRHALAWHDNPEGVMWVNFDKPFNRSDTPMPSVKITED